MAPFHAAASFTASFFLSWRCLSFSSISGVTALTMRMANIMPSVNSEKVRMITVMSPTRLPAILQAAWDVV